MFHMGKISGKKFKQPVMSQHNLKRHCYSPSVHPCMSHTGIMLQVSAVANEPARRAASRQPCCKQRWTLSGINLRPN